MKRASKNTELGDRAAFCITCGWARRYYPGVVEPPETCPACESAVIHACPSCGEDFHSTMTVNCDGCGEPVRPKIVGEIAIRRPPRMPIVDNRT